MMVFVITLETHDYDVHNDLVGVCATRARAESFVADYTQQAKLQKLSKPILEISEETVLE